MSRFQDTKRPKLSGKGLRIGIVTSRFNFNISERLLEGAEKTLREKGVDPKNITSIRIPGAFEIPIMLQRLARRKGRHKMDGLIALGTVIRGETPHFDYVAGEAARGVMTVSIEEGIPIAFGVLTTNNERQALDRAGGRFGNKGEEAALVVLEMARRIKDKV